MKEICYGFIHGLYDSFLGVIYIGKYLKLDKSKGSHTKASHNNSSIFKRIIQCCLLNGLIFWSSIYFFNHALIPLLNYLFFLFPNHTEIGLQIWSYLLFSLKYSFSSLWVLPLFILSRLINCLWFQDIADEAYKKSYGRPLPFSSVGKMVADILFSLLQQSIFLLQCLLMSLLPLKMLTIFMQLLHFTLLYSVYSFEYKWYNFGVEINKRLLYVEKNWPYFIGFGLPLAIMTYIPESYIISGIIFSILFPLLILSANEAKPINIKAPDFSLKLFTPSIYLSNLTVRLFLKLKKRKHLLAAATR